MRRDRPSTTAAWVAAWRSLSRHAKERIADDPIAIELVPQPYAAILRAADRAPRVVRAVQSFADVVTRGQSRHLPFRTRAIDEAIADAAFRGVRQLVVLGAGLDARAWRLDALREVTVFEVDHPGTQSYKRARASSLAPRAREVRFVESDFERGTLASELAAAGHDATRPSVFVWEGVTMYLSAGAIDATLSSISARATAGSTLLATYFARDAIGALKRAVLVLISTVGEPVRSTFTPGELASVLQRHGLAVVEDAGDPEWSARFLGVPQRTSIERLVVATRT